METKFTPGPWGFDSADNTGEVLDSSGQIVADCWPLDVARAKLSGEAFANARLIAAAPELLEALRDLLSARGNFSRADAEVKARAAIAKATEG